MNRDEALKLAVKIVNEELARPYAGTSGRRYGANRDYWTEVLRVAEFLAGAPDEGHPTPARLLERPQ